MSSRWALVAACGFFLSNQCHGTQMIISFKKRTPFASFSRSFPQRWWRSCLLRESAVYLRLEEQAVVCLQTAWRRCRQRRTFLRWRRSAVAVQRSWRIYCRRRTAAAIAVQAAWRGFVERRRYCETYRTVMLLQAMGRGYLARCRYTK